jgi:type I restriction enzyme S subunit
VYLENIALVPEELDGEVASTAFCVLRPKMGIEPRYLYYYVTSKPFIQSVNDLQRGNSPPSVQDGDVKAQYIPLAPTPEQNRIVSKIDELFCRIDEGERALEQVSKLVERYRQSVLKAAVTGELTRDWRAARKTRGEPVESGEALLARILAARRQAGEQAELAKMKAKGIKPTSDNWKKKYREPATPNTTDLPELPEGWIWASLPLLCGISSTNGVSIKGSNTPPGVPALRLDAMDLSGFDYSARRYIPIDQKKAQRLSICTGDFFVSRANGSLALVGRAALAQEPPDQVVFPDTMIRYRMLDIPDCRAWVASIWGSRFVREQVE